MYLTSYLSISYACTVADSAVYLLKWRVSVCVEGQDHERLSNAFWFDIYTFNHQQCLSLSTRNPSTRHMTLDWPSECCSYCPSLRQCSQNTPTELEVQDSGGLAAAWPARSRQRSHSHRSTQPPVLRHPSANINIKVTNKPSDWGCSGPQRRMLPDVNVLFLSGGTLWTEPRWTRSRV